MTRISQKPVELDYLPIRNGGPDQLHTHLFAPTTEEKESCGACAQLAMDFMWIGFNDAVAGREAEFGTVENAMKYAVVNAEGKTLGSEFRDRVAVAA